MSQQIQLQLPDDLVERLQKIADNSGLSLEEVAITAIRRGVAVLLAELSELPKMAAYLETLQDEDLRVLSRHRMNSLDEARLHELSAKGRSGSLSADENQELEQKVALLDRFILLRSKALALLKQRGHDVTSHPAFTPQG